MISRLCAKEIKKDIMEKLEKEIPVLICKLEKIFPPGWFNPM
jgi:archaellum component FlaD/FlaE